MAAVQAIQYGENQMSQETTKEPVAAHPAHGGAHRLSARTFAGATLLAAAAMATDAHAALSTPPSFLVVFGDSYSDSGNAFALTGGAYPYPSGRFSDGPVWVEHLADSLGLAAKPVFAQTTLPADINDVNSNWAVGGAQIGHGNSGDSGGGFFYGFPTGMSAQKDYHIAGIANVETTFGLPAGSLAATVFPGALFVVHAAGNDYFRWTTQSDPAELAAVVADSVTAFGALLTDLHNGSGAQSFLVPNMPGYAEVDDILFGTVTSFRQFAEAFNAALAPQLETLRNDLGVNIIEVDFFGLFDDIVANPGAFGLTDVGIPCVDFGAGLSVNSVCSNPGTTLMWDSVHPTSATHALLAGAAFEALQPVPLPGAVWLAGSAMLALAGIGRRRR
ncbi:MAG: SGNH/GDSL hydrolase family protein [Bradyrhizobium sp.]|uniref:SGNH/GDSL hydrolase family protein n=1 Tax=Bradyrhizobium sp. TaxID=376 RepID=UPI003D0D5B35